GRLVSHDTAGTSEAAPADLGDRWESSCGAAARGGVETGRPATTAVAPRVSATDRPVVIHDAPSDQRRGAAQSATWSRRPDPARVGAGPGVSQGASPPLLRDEACTGHAVGGTSRW